MIVKEEISKCISNIFPDIDHTHFAFGDSEIKEWVESSLLPFLFYQNTVDSQSRIISLFLPESSVSKNLVPIYISMGFFRKVLNKTQNESHFKNESFQKNKRNIAVKGSVVSISEIDYISQIMSLDNGRIKIPFDEILYLRWDLYKGSSYIKDQILDFLEERNKIFKANTGNIFSFPIQPKDTDYEGAIIFTNVNEFIDRLKSIKVSGENILDFVHMQKVTTNKETRDYKVETISNKRKTCKKPVSILVAPNSYAFDYFKIIESQGKTLNHIKTIIWDNFDDLLDKCLRSDTITLEDELNFIKTHYFDKVIDKSLKDIYLINDNYNILLHDKLKQLDLKDSYFSWLLKPGERLHLEKNNSIKPQIIISTISHCYYYELLNKIKEIISSWKQLSKEFSLEGEVIKKVSFLYDLLLAIQTFSDPNILKKNIDNFCFQLHEFRDIYFKSNQDCGIIEKTLQLCSNLNCHNLNFKYDSIIEELLELKLKTGYIILFSRNTNQSDSLYLEKKIIEKFPELNCEFKLSSNIIKEPYLSDSLPDAIIYLDYRDKLRTAPFLNVYGKNQIFILDDYEYSYFENFNNKITPIINDASDDIKKLFLLNLNDPGLISDYDNLKIKLPTEKQNQRVEIVSSPIPYNFEEFFKSIFDNKNSSTNKHDVYSDEYIVFMEDNSHFIWTGSKRVFVFNEESDSLDNSWVSVDSLKPGLEILMVKRDVELKDLINSLLSKKDEYKSLVKDDRIWRDNIIGYIKKNASDYHNFAILLTQNEFEISGITVDNWVNEHVSTPQRFNKLLIILSKLGIMIENDVVRIYESNKKLKTIKISFIRESVKKIICELKGIPYISNNELVDDKIVNELASYININKVKFLKKL